MGVVLRGVDRAAEESDDGAGLSVSPTPRVRCFGAIAALFRDAEPGGRPGPLFIDADLAPCQALSTALSIYIKFRI